MIAVCSGYHVTDLYVTFDLFAAAQLFFFSIAVFWQTFLSRLAYTIFPAVLFSSLLSLPL